MAPADAGVENMVVDPDVGPLDDATAPDGKGPADSGGEGKEQSSIRELIDRWRDTAPEAITRTPDLPLFYPPAVRLTATREGDGVRVRLVGGPRAIRTRWEGDGELVGEGREVTWRPDSERDQLRVGVRSRGGIAVAALRAGDLQAQET
jgi:hypothetical protein